MKYKVGDKVRVRCDLVPYKKYDDLTFLGGNMSKCAGQICTIKEVIGDKKYYVSENPFAWSEEMLETADSKTLRMADGTVIGEFAKEGIIGEFKGIPVYATGGTVSIHNLPTSEWYNPMRLTFKNGSFIKALPQKDDTVRGDRIAYTSNGAPLFAIPTSEKSVSIELPEFVLDDKQAEKLAEEIKKRLANGGIRLKEEKKMPTKFTFYTVDTSRINKTNNTKVDTIMTCVHIGDKVGYATCDKEDYDEREGILNAIANLCCDGSFDKAYRKAVKEKKISETLDCTCSYCRKVFDTIAEREAHEAWHIERRKARHERYLLRKRAKEIAFEEQAQKMAKEMMGEQK